MQQADDAPELGFCDAQVFETHWARGDSLKKQVLFVDDEPKVIQGLERMLRSMRHEWDMSFADSGPQALQILTTKPVDVVVTDMRMPGMDGAELLREVLQRYPQTVRIILSGQSDHETTIRSVGLAHQYLSKPCSAEMLKTTVARACRQRDWLLDEPLQRLVSQMQSLPSLPSLYIELLSELQSGEASLTRAGEIISKDLGMTAKILQLANSSFFGLREHVSSPAEAVDLLGLDTIKALALTVQVFSQFDKTKLPVFSLSALWSHSLAVGRFAELISSASDQDQVTTDNALMAGLLHDCGKLLLATSLPTKYEAVALAQRGDIRAEEAERQILGATHADVGAYLLGIWGLPDPIVEAVAFHHRPGECPNLCFSPLTAVHVANALDHEQRSAAAIENGSSLDAEYLAQLRLTGHLDTWRKLCK